jgi:hypothetical protein
VNDKRRLQNASILRLVLPTCPLRSPGEGKRASENLWVNSTCVLAGGRAGGTTRDVNHRSWSMGLVDVHHRTSKMAASRESEEWNNGLNYGTRAMFYCALFIPETSHSSKSQVSERCLFQRRGISWQGGAVESSPQVCCETK